MSTKVPWVEVGSETDPCCCEEPDCCMYPADKLGVDYGAADLPDAVTVNWTDHLTGSASKSGSSYTSGTVTLAVNAGGTAWELTDTSTTPATTRTVGNCLIRGYFSLAAEQGYIEDQFDGSYSVSFEMKDRDDNWNNFSGTLIRMYHWLWGVSINQASVYVLYDCFNTFNLQHKFMAVINPTGDYNLAQQYVQKDGNSNTPVGSYSFTSPLIRNFVVL